jgi:antitoxin MazE
MGTADYSYSSTNDKEAPPGRAVFFRGISSNRFPQLRLPKTGSSPKTSFQLRGHVVGYTITMYIKETEMQVSKWGNSLAVRLPVAVVNALDLKEGDEIEIRITRERVFEVSRDQSKPHALARLRKLRRPLPPGFVFDREDTNAR